LSPTIPLNPDRKYVNKSTCGPGRAGCPALCIPRRRSILIETIHHSRGPTDPGQSFSSAIGGVCRCHAQQSSPTRDRLLSPSRPLVDPAARGIQFYRISRNFGRSVLVYLLARARASTPYLLPPSLSLSLSFLPLPFYSTTACWNYAPPRGSARLSRNLAGPPRRAPASAIWLFVRFMEFMERRGFRLVGTVNRAATRRHADNPDEDSGRRSARWYRAINISRNVCLRLPAATPLLFPFRSR